MAASREKTNRDSWLDGSLGLHLVCNLSGFLRYSIKSKSMKAFRTIILIAGILVAGLALNTALAQSTDASARKEATYKQEFKAEKKVRPKEKIKIRKEEIKEERKREMKSDMKAQKVLAKREEKAKTKEEKSKPNR